MRDAALAILLFAMLSATAGRFAHAGTQDWQVSEVYRGSVQAPSAVYVELVNEAGGCFFPSSRVELFDANGALLDLAGLVTVTSCFGAPTYFLLATPAAEGAFSVSADALWTAAVPDSGQICFSSSGTRYDCVRWGTVDASVAVVDLFGTSDVTTAPVLDLGGSLARSSTTHVVQDDWMLATPTPRAPNDGSPWSPPDAGPTVDGGEPADAAPVVDAMPLADAVPPPDARTDAGSRRYLDLDAVGGAGCGCQNGRAGDASGMLWVLCVLLGSRGRNRRSLTACRQPASAEKRAGLRSSSRACRRAGGRFPR